MKKVILSVAAMTVFTAVSFAQDAATTQATPVATATPAGEEKKKIKDSEVPQPIKDALKTDAYKEWKLVQAWHVAGANEHYLLEMKKGDETTLLKFTKEGQII